jgi:hypothetical protein
MSKSLSTSLLFSAFKYFNFIFVYLSVTNVHSLAAGYDTAVCNIIITSYFHALAAFQERHFADILKWTSSALFRAAANGSHPVLLSLEVREQMTYILTSFSPSTTSTKRSTSIFFNYKYRHSQAFCHRSPHPSSAEHHRGRCYIRFTWLCFFSRKFHQSVCLEAVTEKASRDLGGTVTESGGKDRTWELRLAMLKTVCRVFRFVDYDLTLT